jgi:hypothetical protein
VSSIDVNDEDRGWHGGARIRPGVVVGGSILLVLGATMLLSTSGAVDVRIGQLIGPIMLITLGVLTVTGSGGIPWGHCRRAARRPYRVRGGASGLWLIGLGIWMLISQMHLWGFTYATSWPLILILSGVMLLVRGIR